MIKINNIDTIIIIIFIITISILFILKNFYVEHLVNLPSLPSLPNNTSNLNSNPNYNNNSNSSIQKPLEMKLEKPLEMKLEMKLDDINRDIINNEDYICFNKQMVNSDITLKKKIDNLSNYIEYNKKIKSLGKTSIDKSCDIKLSVEDNRDNLKVFPISCDAKTQDDISFESYYKNNYKYYVSNLEDKYLKGYNLDLYRDGATMNDIGRINLSDNTKYPNPSNY